MSRPAPHPTNRWFPTFIGISLILLGAVFLFLMARSFLRALEMRRVWPEVPCEILSSEIEERRFDADARPEYRLALSYAYTVQQTRHTGGNISLRGNPWSADKAKAAQQQASYPAGARLTCRVMPSDPAIAVLKPDSLAPGYSIWFPALFVVGGAGLIIGVWRKPKMVKLS